MAFRDSWHRALVYFGLAEERDPYVDEDEPLRARGRARGPLPRASQRPPAGLAAPRATSSTTSSPTTTPPGRARRAQLRSVRRSGGGNGRGDVRVHLVIPKSFNDAQQVADKFKDDDPGRPQPPGHRHRPLQAPDRLRQRAHLRARRRHAADRRQGVHAHAAQRRDLGGGARASSSKRASSTRADPVQLGLIGAGNMARGLARGWGQPVLVHRRVAERAAGAGRRARRRGAARPTPSWRERADLVVLATSPTSSTRWRPSWRRTPGRVVSILGATPLADVKAAYPDRPVVPDPAQHAGRGAPGRGHPRRRRRAGRRARRGVRALLEELGTLVVLDDAPDRRRHGPDVQRAGLLAAGRRGAGRRRRAPRASRPTRPRSWWSQTMAGTAELLRRARGDTLAVAPRGDLAGRLDRPRARRARARPACASAFSRRAGRGARADDRSCWPRFAARTRRLRAGAVRTSTRIIIIAYILSSLYLAFGGRLPYSRWSSAVLGFLRDVCEPYLRSSGASSRRSARWTSARSSAILLLFIVGRLSPTSSARLMSRSGAAWARAGAGAGAGRRCLDQVDQGARARRASRTGDSDGVFPGVDIVHVRNEGVAFGALLRRRHDRAGHRGRRAGRRCVVWFATARSTAARVAADRPAARRRAGQHHRPHPRRRGDRLHQAARCGRRSTSPTWRSPSASSPCSTSSSAARCS